MTFQLEYCEPETTNKDREVKLKSSHPLADGFTWRLVRKTPEGMYLVTADNGAYLVVFDDNLERMQ
jgi:hypothetical protein